MFFRKLVHTCPDCEVIGVLSAAVEHNNQRKLPTIERISFTVRVQGGETF